MAQVCFPERMPGFAPPPPPIPFPSYLSTGVCSVIEFPMHTYHFVISQSKKKLLQLVEIYHTDHTHLCDIDN